MELSTPVKYVKRVGERVAADLAERGVETVEDLLYHLPFRYEDRLHPKPLSRVSAPARWLQLIGEVRGTVLLRTRTAPIFEMTVGVRLRPDAKQRWRAAEAAAGAGDREVHVVPRDVSEGQVQARAEDRALRQAGRLAQRQRAGRGARIDALQDGAADV